MPKWPIQNGLAKKKSHNSSLFGVPFQPCYSNSNGIQEIAVAKTAIAIELNGTHRLTDELYEVLVSLFCVLCAVCTGVCM